MSDRNRRPTDTDGPSPQEEAELNAAAKKVLLAGLHLIKNGYGNLAILPYVAPSGCYWRCEFHPIGRPKKVLFRYSTGQGTEYLASHCGGTVRKTISIHDLAKAIMVSVSDELKEAVEGRPSEAYKEWITDFEKKVKAGYFPIAFEDYSEDPNRWRLYHPQRDGENEWIRPYPGYLQPGDEPTGAARLGPEIHDTYAEGVDFGGRVTVEFSKLDHEKFPPELEELARVTWCAMRDAKSYEASEILCAAVTKLLVEVGRQS